MGSKINEAIAIESSISQAKIKAWSQEVIYELLNSRNEDDEEGGGGDASSVGSPSPTEAKKKDKDKDKDKKDKEKVGFLKKRFGSKKKKAIEKPTPPSPSKALDGVYGIVTSPKLSSQSKIDFGW